MATQFKRVTLDVSRLQNLASEYRQKTADAVNNAIESAKEIATQLAPVSEDGSHGNPPGFLRDNIEITKRATVEDPNAVLEAKAEYSRYVEFGSYNSEAQPFMSPAFESAKKQLREELGRSLRGNNITGKTGTR